MAALMNAYYLMAKPISARHLYEIRVVLEIPLLSAVLPEGLIVERSTTTNFSAMMTREAPVAPVAPSKAEITLAIGHQLT